MEQTATNTDTKSLEDRENSNESSPGMINLGLHNSQDHLPEEEELITQEKSAEHAGTLRSKKYSRITDEQRRDFINAVENDGEKIINAAKRFDINYSSAKSILNVFKNEGRSIKKVFREKIPNKDQKNNSMIFQEGAEKPFFGNELKVGERVSTKNNASTQTVDDGESENSLLALRDRLLASKTDKRQNPYEGLSSHEFSRFSGSLNDYSENQLSCDPTVNNNPSQGFNLSSISNQNFVSQQNVQRADTMGYGNVQNFSPYPQPVQYQPFQNDPNRISPNLMQNNPPLYQPPPFSQGFQLNKPQFDSQGQIRVTNNPSQIAGPNYSSPEPQSLDLSRVGNFEALPRQQGGNLNNLNYGSMIYTGVNPVQYLMMNPANDQMRGAPMEQQYQYLQPIMYIMPQLQNIPMQNNMNQPQNAENYAPQQNNQMMYSQNNQDNNNQGQTQKGGANFNNQYSN